MNMTQKREAAYSAAQDIIGAAKGRPMTGDEVSAAEGYITEVKTWDAKITAATKSAALVASIGGMGANESHNSHGIKGPQFLSLKGVASDVATRMKDSAGYLAKALAPSGEAVASVPMVDGPLPLIGGDGAPRLLEAIPSVTRAAYYRFLRQSTRTLNAGVVAPGGLKPTTTLGVTPEDARLKVIATLSEPVDRFLLEDNESLRGWVATELIDAIAAELESQILTGDGLGENFTGLGSISGVQTQAFQTDALITLRHALSDIETIGVAPAFFALAPADLLTIETSRTTNGSFDVGGPLDAASRRAWGVPTVVVPGLAAGTGYLVGQDSLVLSTDGRGFRVEWSTPGDTFARNELVARVETRANLDALRPHGIVRMALAAA